MALKNKFTREEMVQAALQVVRAGGIGSLTAKTLADALGTSTQPVFTAFGSMERVRQAVYAAAVDIYDGYADAGLQEEIPFLGVGMQYIRFAREEPELYRFLFLTRAQDRNTAPCSPCSICRRWSAPRLCAFTASLPVIYALSDFLIMILSWLVKQSLRAFLFQEVQP